MNDSCHSTSPRAPDPILAELWDGKRQINEQAGYRLDELTRLAEAVGAQMRRRWSQDGRFATAS